MATAPREGNLEAPTRHPLDWRNPNFHDPASLEKELERIFEICHGCRRCVSLCQTFPTLFDLVDASESMEVDGVAKADYWKVVDHCYLCDLCYMTKCPYVPPHEWNLDFPHTMLRAKAVKHRQGEVKLRDRILTSTDAVGRFAGIPIVAPVVNTVNGIGPARKALEAVAGIHSEAWLPRFESRSLRRRLDRLPDDTPGVPAGRTRGKVALFATCYMNRNEPGPGEDLVAVFEHNGIPVKIVSQEKCCGMPKLELGDLDSVDAELVHRLRVAASGELGDPRVGGEASPQAMHELGDLHPPVGIVARRDIPAIECCVDGEVHELVAVLDVPVQGGG
jgi:Fe-S oxidoreductase